MIASRARVKSFAAKDAGGAKEKKGFTAKEAGDAKEKKKPHRQGR